MKTIVILFLTINLSDDEYQSLLESFETETISPTNPGGGDTIDGSSKPAQERTDWGGWLRGPLILTQVVVVYGSILIAEILLVHEQNLVESALVKLHNM